MSGSEPWTSRIPALAGLPSALRDEIERAGRVVRMPRGSRIFGPGQTPQNYMLLLEGDIRVSQFAENGREIVLYRVMPGESCALTSACLLSGEDYAVEALAETDILAVAIPRVIFDDLIGRSPDFRKLVFAAFSQRIGDLFRLVDAVAFQRMDVRLAQKLIELAGGRSELSTTHQQLAVELGTAREVVSRMLLEFQRRGWIASGRGSITLADPTALEKLAREA